MRCCIASSTTWRLRDQGNSALTPSSGPPMTLGNMRQNVPMALKRLLLAPLLEPQIQKSPARARGDSEAGQGEAR
jgi:hypothetical protein